MRFPFIAALCVVLGTSPVLAGGSPLCKSIRTAILDPGFHTYRYYNAVSAVPVFVKGGVLDQAAKKAELAQVWTSAAANLGRYGSYDIIKLTPASEQNLLCYIAVNHAQGSLFLRLLLFEKSPGEFVVNQADLATEPFPEALPQS